MRNPDSIQGNIEDIVTLDVNPNYERHYMSIVFYTDDTKTTHVPISSMTGQIVWSVSDNGVQFGTVLVGDNDQGVMTLGNASYPRPTVRSSLQKVRVDMSGITDRGAATYFELIVNSFAGDY